MKKAMVRMKIEKIVKGNGKNESQAIPRKSTEIKQSWISLQLLGPNESIYVAARMHIKFKN